MVGCMAVIDDYPVRLLGQEAHRLADMAGVLMDLRLTSGTVAQLSRRSEVKGEDMLVLEAMQDSALIHYGRCYKGGVRTAFLIPVEWIEELPSELREAHQYFLNLRDKHIAHSVNDWELNTPVARVRINRETGEINVHAISVNRSRVVMLGSESLGKLWQLAKQLADKVEVEMEAEKVKLLDVARKISPSEIRRRISEDQPDVPGRNDVGTRRHRE